MSLRMPILVAAALLWSASRPAQDALPDEPPTVYASFYPLAWFAERIGGEDVRVVCPVPPGEDPALWRPGRELVGRMQEAQLVFVHGASFERWPDYVSLPLARTVVTTRSFRDRLQDYRSGAVHTHGRQGAPQAHAGIDPHTWLDPMLADEEAAAVHAALTRVLPDRSEELTARFGALRQDLETLRAQLMELAPMLEGVKLIASHPAYEYLAANYGWPIENVAIDPSGPLTPEVRARLDGLRSGSQGTPIVLWEAAPAAQVRGALAEAGFRSVVYSPCETLSEPRRAAGESFLTVMIENLTLLREVLLEER